MSQPAGFAFDRYGAGAREGLRIIAAALLAAGVLTGCDDATQASSAPSYGAKPAAGVAEYLFAVHPLHNPRELHRTYGPLIDHVNNQLDAAALRLVASSDYAAYEEQLYARKFDFALPNPFQTLRSLDHGYAVFGKMADDDDFRGILLTRRGSGVERLDDLRGKTISYPAPTALAAAMMPQSYLHAHGIDVMRETTSRYVGSQESSIMSVYLGSSAAGATWPPPWRRFAAQRPDIAAELEIRWQTEPLVNNGLVARRGVPPDLIRRVAGLLFSLHQNEEGRAILARIDLSRFEPADDASYARVAQFLAEFDRTVRPLR